MTFKTNRPVRRPPLDTATLGRASRGCAPVPVRRGTFPRRILRFLRAGALAATITLVTGASGQIAEAQVLTIEDLSNNLGTVNISTGAVTVIGNLGATYISDIAYSPTGALYGVANNGLYLINPATAEVTYIGALGVGNDDANALVFGQNGTLYTAAASATDLFTVNTSTGAATDLGNIGYRSAGDLAFNGGALYMSSVSNQLIRISLTGGVSGTAVGPLGYSAVYGLATADNGILYGVSGTEIFSINTTTGHGTPVLNYGGQGLGDAGGTSFITEAMPPSASVPESPSCALLALGLLPLGLVARRRMARKDA